MPCYSPLKGFRDPVSGGIVFRGDEGTVPMEVACGSCLGCRLDRARSWAARCVHEAQCHADDKGSVFVTLTYRDKIECDSKQRERGQYIPDDWSLNKSHFQKFMKRLRKFFPQRIRFFHVGEYGNQCMHGADVSKGHCEFCMVGRPHYHALLFNCSFDDLVPYSEVRGETRYTSPTLERIWGYGFVDVGDVTFESAGYCARYCLKKVTGAMAEDHYATINLDGELVRQIPEYATMSRRPGIGKEWFDKYQSDCFPSDEVPVPGAGVFKKVPRFYEDLLERVDPVLLEEVKAERQEFRRKNLDEYAPARLMAKYKVKKAQIETLKRTI